MIKDLIKLANCLDSKGLIREADALDKASKFISKKSNDLSNDNISNLKVSFEEIEKILKDKFPEEMRNGEIEEGICDLLEKGKTKNTSAIFFNKNPSSEDFSIIVSTCSSRGRYPGSENYISYNKENGYIDNSDNIARLLAENSFHYHDGSSGTWGGRIKESSGKLYVEPSGFSEVFYPLTSFRDNFNSKENIDGTWIHVLNMDQQISSVEDLLKFLSITGEVSVSTWDPEISKRYFIKYPRNWRSAFAIIMSGKASYCWDKDIWSKVDSRTGLRYPTRWGSENPNSEHDECFLIPAKSKPIMALVGPEADPKEAENFIQAAESIGLPVTVMSLTKNKNLDNKIKEDKYYEWLDYEDSFKSRGSKGIKDLIKFSNNLNKEINLKGIKMIKDLIKIANNLDSKGLSKEADFLDSLIQKLAASRDWLKKLETYEDDFDSESPEKIKRFLLNHGVMKEDILGSEEGHVVLKQHWVDAHGDKGWDLIPLKTLREAYKVMGY